MAALQRGRTVQKSDPHYLSERKEEGGGGQTGRRKEWMSSLVSAALTVRRDADTHTHTPAFIFPLETETEDKACLINKQADCQHSKKKRGRESD